MGTIVRSLTARPVCKSLKREWLLSLDSNQEPSG